MTAAVDCYLDSIKTKTTRSSYAGTLARLVSRAGGRDTASLLLEDYAAVMDRWDDAAAATWPDGAGEEVAVRIGQAVLKTLESGGGLEQLMAAHQAVAAFHGNNYLPLLEAFYHSHRAVLFTLVDAIELEATSAERGVLDALEFIRAVRHRRGEWIEETCVVNRGSEQVRVSIDINAFASEMWKRTLRDKRRPQRADILY